MDLWNDLRSRMDNLRESLIFKSTTADDVDIKREICKMLYHHGWLSSNLEYCRPSLHLSAVTQAAELADLLVEVNMHEDACADA
jgi:hypothetical protein